jgi:N-acetylglucosaminyl-diphospho-decaprenol L-rhamnosyltransferase
LTPEAATPEPQPKRVSIVIVSFNRAETLRKSLDILGDAHQILVVDNGSSDDSPRLDADYPAVRFIRLPKNFGLTKALNIGLRAADGEYVLFLHDDARISGGDVDRLAGFLEARADVGAVCPLLTDESGTPGPQVCSIPSPPAPDLVFRPAEGGEEILAECVSGAAIMFRTFFLRALRQIDERYGNYGSIIDLCAQVRRASRKIVILRAVTAVHEGLESPLKKSALEGDRSAGTAVYLGKHYGFMAGMLYRIKAGMGGLVTFRFKVVAGAFSGEKIDGTN